MMEQVAATPAILIRNVSKAFHKRPVLEAVNLAVSPGESVVIVGPSGSGKSVLIKHIIGFMQPDKGSVEIYGRAWHSMTPQQQDDVRANFGMVFQRDALFDAYTLAENVAFPLEIRNQQNYSSSAIRQRTDTLLDEVGLREYGNRKPAECSGGMCKRAGLARALASEPKIILYDEPTTGLDAGTSIQISELIRKVHDAHDDVTSITITHDYLCAAFVADRIFYLDKHARTLVDISADIDEIKRQYHIEKERHENIRTWIEARFSQAPPDNDENSDTEDVSRQSSAKIGLAAVAKYVASGIGFIGEVFFDFVEMGLPLRIKDFLDRLVKLGIYSLPLMFGAGFFIGMIGVVQFYLGVGRNVDQLPTPLPTIFAGVLLRILSPLLVGFLLAGRVGAHVAAEIGTKQFGNQFDALRSLAISPKRFLLSPIVLALALTTPVMTLLNTWAGIFGGYFIWLTFDRSGSGYWHNAFAAGVWNAPDVLYVVAKSIAIGILVALISYRQGAQPKISDEEIALSTQRAVLLSSITVVVFDFLANYAYAQYLG